MSSLSFGTAGAQNLSDIQAHETGGAAYVLVAGITPDNGAINGGLNGQAGGNDLNSPTQTNATSDLAAVLANHLFTNGSASTGLGVDSSALAFAYTAAHEAAHTFGLRHTNNTGVAGDTQSGANDLLLTSSDIISKYYDSAGSLGAGRDQRYNFNFFTRFTLDLPQLPNDEHWPAPGTENPYNILATNLGLRPNSPAYVTGTGANDHITITSTGVGTATVTVQAYSDTPMTSLITTQSYVISTANGILVETGAGTNRIELNANLGVSVTIDGISGNDQLQIDGANGMTATYTPGTFSSTSLDGRANYTGSITAGNTTVNFDEFNPTNSSVVLQNINTVSVAGSSGDDNLTVRRSGSQNQVSGTEASGVGIVPLLFSGASSLNINAGGGNDSLSVDSSNGLVTVPINYDGGTGVNSLHLIQPTSATVQTSDVYSVGPNPGQGSDVIKGPSGTQTVNFQNLTPLTDLVPVTTQTVNATSSDNAISYTAGPNSGLVNASNPTGLKTGQVSVDNFEPIEFANKTNLVINDGGGTDTVSLGNATTPAGLTGTITVNGSDPSKSDTLIINGVAATLAVNTTAQTISGAAGAATIDYSTIKTLQINAASSTTLSVSGSTSYQYLPGTATDAGTIQTDALSLLFSGFGTGDTLLFTGSGGNASAVVNGTAANDSFTVANAAGKGQVNLNNRPTILTTNIPTMSLEGLDGNDIFTLLATLAASPYTTLHLDGGDPASASGDQATLAAGAAAGDVTVSGQTISQGGKTVVGSGLEGFALNGAGNRLIYNGVAGVQENVNVIGSPTANAGQLSIPGVVLLAFSNVPGLVVNGNAADNDTLTFTGTNNPDLFQINLAAAGTAADPVLQLQNPTAATLLVLQNYTGFSTLNVDGLDGRDQFNVLVKAVAPGGGRNLALNGDLPAGGRKPVLDVLNVAYVGRTRPSIKNSPTKDDPTSGLVYVAFEGGAAYLVQYAGMESVNTTRAK
jgi:hypothetical protein